MRTLLLYLATVCIWGTTWFAIKLQLGEVPAEVSVFYRFALAAFLLLIYCTIKRHHVQFTLKDHLSLFFLGISMFSVHYVFIYKASLFIVSGLVSVLFSSVALFNILNSFLFLKKVPEMQVFCGACIGIAGLVFFFWSDCITFSFKSKTLMGVGLAITAGFLFSISNILARKNQKKKMDLISSTSISMFYGSFVMLAYVVIAQLPFVFPHNLVYWSSLLYLVIPGTVVGFLCYLTLISRIGPERAGYVTVFFPVIALSLSYFLESYNWKLFDILGIAFIMIGNCLVIFNKKTTLS